MVMSQTPSAPAPPPEADQPSREFCFHSTALRDFLRLSRATVDDSISANLNSLLTPSRTQPFVPSMTSSRQPAPHSRREISGATCHHFIQAILFPSWHSRSQVLRYCNGVARTSDATATTPQPTDGALGVPVSRNYWGKEQTVDERLDPYSARDYSYTRESQTEVLKGILANEEGVERIIRERTWGVLNDRCVNGVGQRRSEMWEEDFNRWVEAKRRPDNAT